jgi:hypothetical protein
MINDYLNLEDVLNGYFNHLINVQNTSFHDAGTNFKTYLGVPPELSLSGENKSTQLTLNVPTNEKKEDVIRELFQGFYSSEIPKFEDITINLKINSIDFQERQKKGDIYFININYTLYKKKETKWAN